MSFEINVTGLCDSALEIQPGMGDEKENSIPVIVIPSNASETVYQQNVIASATCEVIGSDSTLPVSCTIDKGNENSVLHDISNAGLASNIDISLEVTEQDSVNKISSNYVHQILSKSYEGNFQLATYNFESIEKNREKLLETKKKTYFSKNKIAKIVVNHEFHRTNNFHISSDRFMELAKLSSEVFTTVLPESFYSKATLTKSAGGAFQTYYSKQREKELAIGRLKAPIKRKLSEEPRFEDLKTLQEKVNIIDENYIKLWSETAAIEKRELYQRKELKCIVETLPNLAHPLGYLLIEADFKAHYNKPSNLFVQNFNDVAPKLIAIAKSKRDTEVKEIIAANSQYSTDEHRRTLALLLLPYLFKRTAKITSRSKVTANWTPHHHEVLKSFIIHLKVSDNLQESLKTERNKLLDLYNDHKLIARPYVLIYGATVSDIQAAFVIAGPITYQVSSVSLAVDICFQLHKVLHEPYSIICNHIWQFLERKIYGFQVTNLYATVTALIEKVN